MRSAALGIGVSYVVIGGRVKMLGNIATVNADFHPRSLTSRHQEKRPWPT
jgi:hypothetical protein